MYLRATSYPLSLLRFLAVCAVLLIGAVKEGYGQRVYADAQQSGSTNLASVNLPGNAVVLDDSDTLSYSTLNVGVGLLDLFYAQQNLYFNNVSNPGNGSPIVVKFSTPGSILDLLGGFTVQRTNNSNINTLISPSYGGTSLLQLLGLLGGGNTAMFVIPPTGDPFNGVRIRVSSTLSLGREARYYYAFYITPPEVSSTITACEGTPVDVVISNYDEAVEVQGYPYTYQLYTNQLLPADPSTEIQIENVTFNDGILTLPADLPAGVYYLEARENGIYPSARTKITLLRNNVTGGEITGTQTLCADITPAQLSETTASSGTGMLTYQWQSKTSGNYTDIPSATTSTYNPPTLSETTMYRRTTKLTVNGEVCEAFSNEITITVNPVPTISLNASTIHVCQEDDVADFPYSTVTNTPVSYSIQWYPTAQDTGFQDISNETHNFSVTGGNIPISIPPGATEGTYQGVLTVKNSLGCISTGQTLMINVLPKPSAPNLNINPNSQY